ncbi:MAG: sulfate ABC transporter permease subunit CysW [Vicinamibacterales bacterium]
MNAVRVLAGVGAPAEAAGVSARGALTEPAPVRVGLTAVALLFLGLFLLLPLGLVFAEAFRGGAGAWLAAIRDPDALAAFRLTALVVAIALPINLAFGLSAAWAIARFRFRGRALLLTLIDLPFAVSPVVAGLVLMLLLGRQGVLGPWLDHAGVQALFAVPAIVLATLFVSSPFIAREVIPVMEAGGGHEEEAARLLGASGLQTFARVTLPNITWGVVYGVTLSSARVVGEFGAVSVVSGRIRGLTNTLPLHVEAVYNEYNLQAAFAVASVLTGLALVTLAARAVAERHAR